MKKKQNQKSLDLPCKDLTDLSDYRLKVISKHLPLDLVKWVPPQTLTTKRFQSLKPV